MESPIVLLLAAGIDYLIGDPWGWPHPVRVMGWVITHLTRLILQKWSNPNVRRWAGIFLGLGVVTGSGWVGWLIGQGANWLHPWLGITVQSIVLASCFASKSLRKAAEDVLLPLEVNDVLKARDRLSQYVGRDTENLSTTEILRAVLETVTENATDGVMAPLFYAILGAALPGIGCLPFALAYKAASTLDSMVGYREPPYTDLGWFSARLEDTLSWVPCRLTVITLGLISGKLRHVWQLCSRDAIKDVSPNSGWSECAYAAILGVQMGGENWYRGVAKYKPLLGDAIHPITSKTIHQALQLTRYSFLVWLGLAIALLLILNLG